MRVDRIVAILVFTYQVVAACFVLLLVQGCQPGPTTVSGKVTLDGKDLTVPADARGTVIFQPNGGKGTMATGLLDSTGHFKLATGSSIEVPPGKYYVTVSVAKLLAKTENEEQGAELITPAKYASANDSGLEAQVTPGENNVIFDLKSGDSGGSAKALDSPTEPAPSKPTPPSDSAPKANDK